MFQGQLDSSSGGPSCAILSKLVNPTKSQFSHRWNEIIHKEIQKLKEKVYVKSFISRMTLSTSIKVGYHQPPPLRHKNSKALTEGPKVICLLRDGRGGNPRPEPPTFPQVSWAPMSSFHSPHLGAASVDTWP